MRPPATKEERVVAVDKALTLFKARDISYLYAGRFRTGIVDNETQRVEEEVRAMPMCWGVSHFPTVVVTNMVKRKNGNSSKLQREVLWRGSVAATDSEDFVRVLSERIEESSSRPPRHSLRSRMAAAMDQHKAAVLGATAPSGENSVDVLDLPEFLGATNAQSVLRAARANSRGQPKPSAGVMAGAGDLERMLSSGRRTAKM